MYNGSDSNTSAHTRFAKPLETLRTSHYPETYSIIHYLSPTWSAKPWNLTGCYTQIVNAADLDVVFKLYTASKIVPLAFISAKWCPVALQDAEHGAHEVASCGAAVDCG